MLTVLRGLWAQFRPQRRGESNLDWARRRHPHLPIPPWTDGTD